MNEAERIKIREQLIRHEGMRLTLYQDSVGKWTIGVGRNIHESGISRQEALMLLENDIDHALSIVSRTAWWGSLDAVRRRVVVDMTFNLGAAGFRGFKRLNLALTRLDYETAAHEMRNSKWYSQVGERAARLARMMETGEDG